jgi:hypothetical protein
MGATILSGGLHMLEGFVNVSAMLRPGVYALVKDGVVVYVGQSKKPLSRVEAHRSLWGRKKAPGWLPIRGILFDEVHVMPCRVEQLDEVERALIDLYKPKFNVKLKSPLPVTTEFAITVGDCVIAMNAPPARSGFVRRM